MFLLSHTSFKAILKGSALGGAGGVSLPKRQSSCGSASHVNCWVPVLELQGGAGAGKLGRLRKDPDLQATGRLRMSDL